MAELDLERKYYDPKVPGSLSGANTFYKNQSSSSRKEIKEFLSGEDAYTLHFPVRFKFRRNKIVVGELDQTWESDLIDMQAYADANDGFRYILMAVDVLSRFAFTRALKTKTTREVKAALESIFEKSGRKPSYLRTDKGREYVSGLMQRYLQENHIHHYVTENAEIKSSICERLNKTFRARLARYFSKKQKAKWVDILDDVTHSYNNTVHSSIGMKPAEVTKGEKESLAWRHQYQSEPDPPPDGPFKLDVGQTVRISHMRRAFQREYDERYTKEIFRVSDRSVRGGLNIYKLRDLAGEDLTGSFYQKELLAVTVDPDGVFHIEKVLKTRRRKGQKEHLIRWAGYPPKFDSWVKASDFVKV